MNPHGVAVQYYGPPIFPFTLCKVEREVSKEAKLLRHAMNFLWDGNIGSDRRASSTICGAINLALNELRYVQGYTEAADHLKYRIGTALGRYYSVTRWLEAHGYTTPTDYRNIQAYRLRWMKHLVKEFYYA